MTCFLFCFNLDIHDGVGKEEFRSSYLYAVCKRSANIFTRINAYRTLRHLLLSIQYPDVEEIYMNVSVLFILKKLPIALLSVSSLTNYLDILLNGRNCNIQSNNQPSTIELVLMRNHQDQTNKQYRPHHG